MPRLPATPRNLLTALVLVGLMGFAGFGAGLKLESAQRYSDNVARSNSLVLDLVRRVELATDYAFITISELSGLAECSRAAIAKAEASLLTRGTVRAVAVSNGASGLSCAAPDVFREAAALSELDAEGFLLARNNSVSLGHINELLLVRVAKEGQFFTAASSLGTMLYDFLPADLRDEVVAKVSLTDGETVAYFKGIAVPDEPGPIRHFSASSTRYPIATEIAVPETALSSRGRDGLVWQPAAGGLIGMLATGLLAALALKARTARDDLLDAIATGQIVPHYQPIFHLDGGNLSGCEALARWIKPDGTKIGPDRFIPLAEAEGLIGQLTKQLALTCARDLGPLCRGRPDFKLSINMPPDLLLTPDFLGDLDRLFAREDLPRRNVVFEVTERQSPLDAKAVKETISAARELGFRFALDDTGVGHNGLANVQSLPVDFIKIDKCFVDMVDTSPESSSIVRMLVWLAGELGIKTVAEGIERDEQIAKLQEIGVDEGQGYLVAPALPADAFLKLAAEWVARGQNEPAGETPSSQDSKRSSSGLVQAA